MSYSADELINWSYDDHGQYQWVVLRTQSLRKERIEDAAWAKQTRWVYYDKEKYRIYEQAEARNAAGARLRWWPKGRHGLAKQLRVPLVELRVSEGLWLLEQSGVRCNWSISTNRTRWGGR